jgi:hypothetical protein
MFDDPTHFAKAAAKAGRTGQCRADIHEAFLKLGCCPDGAGGRNAAVLSKKSEDRQVTRSIRNRGDDASYVQREAAQTTRDRSRKRKSGPDGDRHLSGIFPWISCVISVHEKLT